MSTLAYTFGGGLTNEQPLMAALTHWVGRPVRVRCVDASGELWLRGRIESVCVPDDQVLEPRPEIAVSILYPGVRALRFETTTPGVVVWSCPRRRVMTVVYDTDGRRYELHDDRAVCAIDSIERDLVVAMSEPDPERRFDRMVAMCEVATVMGDTEPDDQLRARLVALSVCSWRSMGTGSCLTLDLFAMSAAPRRRSSVCWTRGCYGAGAETRAALAT